MYHIILSYRKINSIILYSIIIEYYFDHKSLYICYIYVQTQKKRNRFFNALLNKLNDNLYICTQSSKAKKTYRYVYKLLLYYIVGIGYGLVCILSTD